MKISDPSTDARVGAGERGSSSAAQADEDLPLVDATKHGDLSAFDQLVRRYDRRLLRIAQNVTHDPSDAQDVVQDAFLKAFQRLDQFRAMARFSTWLIRITLNEALTKVRKLRNHRELPAEEVQEEMETAPSRLSYWVRDPGQLCSASEFREILSKSLESLSPRLRIVFVLRDIEELSINKTAEALGLSVAAVTARLFRARLQLRDKLSKHFAIRERGSRTTTRAFRASAGIEFDNVITIALQSEVSSGESNEGCES
jgi:RNA polymerase sigma-70 factor, ECF subfamily